MRISGGGSANLNLLLSDAAQFRNEDFVVDNNGAFWGYTSSTGAVGEYMHVQLFNPAGSGITVLVDRCQVVSDVDGGLRFGFYDTELTSDIGAGASKKNGGAAAKAHIRRQSIAAITGTILINMLSLADVGRVYDFPYPLELAEGEGAIVTPSVTASDTYGAYEWREV